ncbi:MAG TPA: nitroreductase family deazaflavin-dependent oxidoreductase [Acidimicrobiales bacterium]|nr:nitroreductase family deazaflavin-dependent oxidoreductase [Acidimicrobiales bacterium]
MNLKDVVARGVTTAHAAVFRLTDGRVGGKLFGMPTLLITTTGRKSGKARTTMLTTPMHDDDTVVLVASYGGDSRHPTWFLNLRDNPDVEVVLEGRTRRMKARVASAEEKATLWPQVIAGYKGYDAYQRRTDRDIPVVILEP